MRGTTLIVFSCVAMLMTCGCSGPGAPGSGSRDDGPINIVCTTGMVADIVRQVAGPHASVIALMGEGVDPHLYVPTRSDIVRLNEADIVFYNGLLLEGQMEPTFERLAKSGRRVHAVTADIPAEKLRSPPGFEGHSDPHVWMDVQLWSQAVDAVARHLATFDPAHELAYRDNAAAYRKQLEALDEYARQAIASIPEAKRYLVTAHDAFGYFATAYGIAEQSVQGITTESEAGVDDINRLVDLLVSRQIPAIFVETSVNEKNLQAVMNGAMSRGWNVRKGGSLYSDAMGPEGTYEGTYIGMMDHNVTTIASALGGDVPAGGMQGKLSETP